MFETPISEFAKPTAKFACWHFDALSDDGRKALVITFNDNYAFSPRYFRDAKHPNIKSGDTGKRFPAVTFTYSVEGKVVLRAVNEFRAAEFSTGIDGNKCSIGNSSFRLNSTEYGSGYMLQIHLLTPRRYRLEAEIEFLSIEAGAGDHMKTPEQAGSFSKIVAPRSDVSGRITRLGRSGSRKVFHFRGTGYHEHFGGERPLEETVGSRWSGRVHFADSTAVFHRDQTKQNTEASSKLFLVRDGSIHERDVQTEVRNVIRDRYGLTIPGRLTFTSEDNMRLRVKPVQVIESGFFKKSVVSEMTLTLRDGKPRKAFGIAEFVAPGRLKNPLFRWFTDLRIGKNGKWPWF